MNNIDKQYTDLLQDILDNGVTKQDRTGTGTLSVFGRQIRHKMSEGFPLLTTKKMAWKSIVTELLWFLRGDTSIKYLLKNDCNIWTGDAFRSYEKKAIVGNVIDSHYEPATGKWNPYNKEEFINKIKTDDEFAKKWGELGKIYGAQWRSWTNYTGDEIAEGTYEMTNEPIDQIKNLINELKTNTDSRRLLVSAWNVADVESGSMVLPPCHYGFQVYTRELSQSERIKLLDIRENANRNTFAEQEGFMSYVLDKHNIPTRAISLMYNTRSQDVPLGTPFNIASYALLLEIIAKEVNMVPDELIANMGDCHIYLNQIEGVKEQIGRELSLEERKQIAENEGWYEKDNFLESLKNMNDTAFVFNFFKIPNKTREPYSLPTVKISDRVVNDISEYTLDDIILENYQSHPAIKMPLSN